MILWLFSRKNIQYIPFICIFSILGVNLFYIYFFLGQRASTTQTSSLADTGALICAISIGKGLKPQSGSPKGQPTNPQPPPQQPTRPGKSSFVKLLLHLPNCISVITKTL